MTQKLNISIHLGIFIIENFDTRIRTFQYTIYFQRKL